MASLQLLHRGGRALPWLRPCQTRHRSVRHGATGSVADSAVPRPTPCGPGRDAASRRRYRPSPHPRNADGRSPVAAPGAVARAPREEGRDDAAPSGASFADVPGATNTKGRTLAIVFTCAVCDTRSAKQFTEHAYRRGVVLVQCPGCKKHHLIADRLGWFDDGDGAKDWDVERAMAKAGERVRAVTGEDVLELTLDDVLGRKS